MNATLCPECKRVVKNLRKHRSRKRCEAQGEYGVKAGMSASTPNRRKGGYDIDKTIRG